jgi:phage FluMu protein gp41
MTTSEPGRRARLTDPETSREAAQRLSGVAMLKRQIVNVLDRDTPLTDEEIFKLISRRMEASPSGVRSRRSELVREGKVRDSGLRAKTRTGRRAIRWELV